MRRLVCVSLCMLLCMGLLAGCGTTLESDSSVVYVDKSGKVISLDVENLDQDYYDTTELEAFINEEIQVYTKANGKNTVSLKSLTVENGTAKLKMEYESVQDYTGFNGIELFAGTIVEALEAAYIYDGDFVRVENGQVVGAATKQEIYNEPELKTVIIRANTDVKIDGEICYISCENVKLTGADSVSIREGYYLEGGNGPATESVVGTEMIDGTEVINITEGTEAMESTEVSVEAEETEQISDEQQVVEGSFETDVYTFIVYK